MKTAVVYLFVLSSVLILLGANVVAARDYNAVELKVYNKNTNEVYYDKIIPADQPFHVTLTIDNTLYDITYDPSRQGVDRELECSGGTCKETLIIGSSGWASDGPIVVRTIPTNASFSSAPIPMGTYVLGGLLLVTAFLLRRNR